MRAAIYCRVSTEEQEREGTSLQTQLEACLKRCQDKDYGVAHRFSEAYSGLTLDRPKLNELRELVRSGDIDIIMVYCLDRLSRDPTHGVILTQELEKYHVTLEAVTEDIDTSELGKLISYIRGFASKLEAEKIRERTSRGRRARLQSGKLLGGVSANLYGYRYQCGSGIGEGTRYIDSKEAEVVRQIYDWYLSGDTLNKIVTKLYALGIPSPKGNRKWDRSSLWSMLKNRGYTGVAEFCGIQINHDAIILPEVYEKVEAKFKRNKELSPRNSKGQYLLSGHVFCSNCGRRLCGTSYKVNGIKYRYYYCTNGSKRVSLDPCPTENISAESLESSVWTEVKKALLDPEIIARGLESIDREDYSKEMETIEARLKHFEGEKDRCWKAYLLTGDEPKFKDEIEKVTKTIGELEERYKELQSLQETINGMPTLEDVAAACEIVRGNLGNLTHQEKRICLEALNIRVRVGDKIRLEGVLPIVLKPSYPSKHNITPINITHELPFCIPVELGDLRDE